MTCFRPPARFRTSPSIARLFDSVPPLVNTNSAGEAWMNSEIVLRDFSRCWRASLARPVSAGSIAVHFAQSGAHCADHFGRNKRSRIVIEIKQFGLSRAQVFYAASRNCEVFTTILTAHGILRTAPDDHADHRFRIDGPLCRHHEGRPPEPLPRCAAGGYFTRNCAVLHLVGRIHD